MSKRDDNWQHNYDLLHEYVAQHGQLPDKKKVENRGLLNWWKYNRRQLKAGTLDAGRAELLEQLSAMRRITAQTRADGD